MKTYSVCNNYNIQEARTQTMEAAQSKAQEIANRDNMPAFIDVYMDGSCVDAETVEVVPEVVTPLVKPFREMLKSIETMDANQLKVEISIIKAGKGEYSEVENRMLLVRMNQYLVKW
jgi:hypothetical protein